MIDHGTRFSIAIEAPRGLEGIEPHLDSCLMKLSPWRPDPDGRVFLRKDPANRELEWWMDPSHDAILFASGFVHGTMEKAEVFLESLSSSLADAGFAHEILISNEEGSISRKLNYRWSGTRNPRA